MKCLKRDCDEGMSFSTHFLVIGLIWIWQGRYVPKVLFLFFLIAIHNFLILKHGDGRDMLMTRMTSIILSIM
jgi:hypothetical protein